MENKVPDFCCWIELKNEGSILTSPEGAVVLEIKKYVKISDMGKLQDGALFYFFGQEMLMRWTNYTSNDKLFCYAIKTEDGKWEVSLPVSEKELEDVKNSKCFIVKDIQRGEVFISINIFTATGWKKRTISKKINPPK